MPAQIYKEWDDWVQSNDKPKLVMFYASWCGYSQKALEALKKAVPNIDGTKIKIVAIEERKIPLDWLQDLEITGWPTIKIVHKEKNGHTQIDPFNFERTIDNFIAAAEKVIKESR